MHLAQSGDSLKPQNCMSEKMKELLKDSFFICQILVKEKEQQAATLMMLHLSGKLNDVKPTIPPGDYHVSLKQQDFNKFKKN